MQVIRVLSRKWVGGPPESLVQALVSQTRNQREESLALNFTQGSGFFTIPVQEDVRVGMPDGDDTARGTGLHEFHHCDPRCLDTHVCLCLGSAFTPHPLQTHPSAAR